MSLCDKHTIKILDIDSTRTDVVEILMDCTVCYMVPHIYTVTYVQIKEWLGVGTGMGSNDTQRSGIIVRTPERPSKDWPTGSIGGSSESNP